MARVICVKPCVPSFSLALPIPFIGSIKPIAQLDLHSDCSGCDLLASLFIQINPFIMSLGIPLCALGCLTAVIGMLKAIPDSLGPPPDPTKLVTALALVLQQCKCVLDTALPPPAGPICQFLKFVLGLLQAALAVITCISTLLAHLVTLQLRATTLALNLNPDFVRVGQCLTLEVENLLALLLGKFNSLGALFGALAPVFALINLLIPIPQLNDIATAFNAFAASVAGSPPITTVVSALQTLEDALTVVVNALATAVLLCP